MKVAKNRDDIIDVRGRNYHSLQRFRQTFFFCFLATPHLVQGKEQDTLKMNTLLKGTTRRPSIVMLPLLMVLLSNSEVHSFQSHCIKAPWHQSTSHQRKGISLDHQRPRINRGTSSSTSVMSGLGDAWTTYASYLDSAPIITKVRLQSPCVAYELSVSRTHSEVFVIHI